MGHPRVLVVTTVHTPLDARIHARQLRSMVVAGWPVTYAAPFADTGTSPALVHDGVRTLDLPRSVGRRRGPSLRSARRLLAAEGQRHDLVLLHDPELLAAVAGQRGVLPPIAWDVHEDTAAALVDRPWVPPALRGAVGAAVHAAERWAEEHLHLLLAEEGYRERFRRRHPVVPNVPWAVAAPEVEPDVEPRVVLLGRVARGRGGADAVAAARLLAPDGIRVELVGPVDDDLRDEVEAAVRDGVLTSHGFVPNDRALALLDGALAGLSLHHDEPNHLVSRPVKALEYLAHGVPVVATPIPAVAALVDPASSSRLTGAAEAGSPRRPSGPGSGRVPSLAGLPVRPSTCGIVVPFRDPAAIAAAVLRLRDDEGLRAAMVAEGRRVAAARAWDVEQEAFLDALRGWARPRVELPTLPDEPRVDVVVPARDAAATLPAALASLAGQWPTDRLAVQVAVHPDDEATRDAVLAWAAGRRPGNGPDEAAPPPEGRAPGLAGDRGGPGGDRGREAGSGHAWTDRVPTGEIRAAADPAEVALTVADDPAGVTPAGRAAIAAGGGRSGGVQPGAGPAGFAVTVVDNPAGVTPAGLNAAIAAGDGDVVVRLDAHSTLPAGYVARAVAALRTSGAGNVGGRQVTHADTPTGRAIASAAASPLGAGGAVHRSGTAAGPADTVYLGVFHRPALAAVGGFDERLVRNQDYELNLRLRRAGLGVWFEPDLAATHHGRETLGRLARQYHDYGRWRAQVARLHPGTLRARQLAAPVLVGGLAAAAMHLALDAAGAGPGATASAPRRAVHAAATGAARAAWLGYPALLVVDRLRAADGLADAGRQAVALAVMHLSWGTGFLRSLAAPPLGRKATPLPG